MKRSLCNQGELSTEKDGRHRLFGWCSTSVQGETRLVGLYGKKQTLVWQKTIYIYTSNVDPNTMMQSNDNEGLCWSNLQLAQDSKLIHLQRPKLVQTKPGNSEGNIMYYIWVTRFYLIFDMQRGPRLGCMCLPIGVDRSPGAHVVVWVNPLVLWHRKTQLVNNKSSRFWIL